VYKYDPDSKAPFVLGTYGAAHLGDILCATLLPRLLSEAGVGRVHILDRQVCRTVFSNNPHVAGFSEGHTISLDRRVRGAGHIIQRLLNSFELPLNGAVKPELYFSEEELKWARTERNKIGGGKPICILASRGFTDAWHLAMVDWKGLARALSKSYTVIHPVLTNKFTYQDQIGGAGDNWACEPQIEQAITYRDLPLRRYLSLFTFADLYVGGPSGGSHVAAAMAVPATIILWKKKLEALVFPVPANKWSVDVFLYPQHQFLAAEELMLIDEQAVERLKQVLTIGSAVGLNSQSQSAYRTAWNVAPIAPRRVIQTKAGRLIRKIGIYGDGNLNTPWAPAARV
jgi:hypothetical protein